MAVHSSEASYCYECQLPQSDHENVADTKIARADPICSDNGYQDNASAVAGKTYTKREVLRWNIPKQTAEQGLQQCHAAAAAEMATTRTNRGRDALKSSECRRGTAD